MAGKHTDLCKTDSVLDEMIETIRVQKKAFLMKTFVKGRISINEIAANLSLPIALVSYIKRDFLRNGFVCCDDDIISLTDLGLAV